MDCWKKKEVSGDDSLQLDSWRAACNIITMLLQDCVQTLTMAIGELEFYKEYVFDFK